MDFGINVVSQINHRKQIMKIVSELDHIVIGLPIVSEYQYYEFQAVDKPLSIKDRETLRDLSTIAQITSTSFINEYNWGDFKGEPLKLMVKYFDAFLYLLCFSLIHSLY
jgi:hypothetical protein